MYVNLYSVLTEKPLILKKPYPSTAKVKMSFVKLFPVPIVLLKLVNSTPRTGSFTSMMAG